MTSSASWYLDRCKLFGLLVSEIFLTSIFIFRLNYVVGRKHFVVRRAFKLRKKPKNKGNLVNFFNGTSSGCHKGEETFKWQNLIALN